MDNSDSKERGEECSDMPYNSIDYSDYEYYYYIEVFEGIIKADAQRHNSWGLHYSHSQSIPGFAG